ncbi:MAG: pyridoxal phosphate-dependent aminotransferase family protein [Verrucomicrobia bacterium]|nr:pyridoxal phosphate-dependent aminotransferase family protein [Verrucomicrobiota bacterium]
MEPRDPPSRLPRALAQVDRTCVRWGRRRLSYFGGCDYFRLSSHPQVLAALAEGLARHGLNVAASRTTTGNHAIYAAAESRLARFFGAERAVLAPTGYTTNLLVAQGLAGTVTHAVLDQRAHASLRDAATLCACPVIEFPHRDEAGLAAVLRSMGARARPLVLTDGLFACDGTIAPLRAYLRVMPTSGWLLVDDAHGAGVLGRLGRGAVEQEGANRARLIQTCTLSKSFGVYGGVVLATQTVADRIVERSRLFAGSTPLPPPWVAAALAALRVFRTEPGLRQRLADNTRLVKSVLRDEHLPVVPTPAPILAVYPRHRTARDILQRQLLRRDIFPSFICYPGGPPQGYYRFAISSEHSRDQLLRLSDALVACRELWQGA